MDAVASAILEAVVGMAVTILLLSLLGGIFYIIGKIEQRRIANKAGGGMSKPAVESAAIDKPSALLGGGASKEDVTATLENLPYIAAAVQLYLEGSSGRLPASKAAASVGEECRKEWKRSARLCGVGLE
ncbi:MAG: hypothetical protein H5T33_04585 [Candidatus Methanosuratus sp.]|nr:hypothetical protein [Candidatus Methanosuratincola sp.]